MMSDHHDTCRQWRLALQDREPVGLSRASAALPWQVPCTHTHAAPLTTAPFTTVRVHALLNTHSAQRPHQCSMQVPLPTHPRRAPYVYMHFPILYAHTAPLKCACTLTSYIYAPHPSLH